MTYKPTDIADEGTIVLRSSNIRNGKIDLTDLVRVKIIIRENQFVEQNDIVICARNGSKALVGKCAIFNLAMSESVSFGAFMAILRTAFYDYVYYFLNTQLFRNILNSDDSKQINQLTQDVLKNTLIPFPPQNEQRKIVTALNEIMHQISSIVVSSYRSAREQSGYFALASRIACAVCSILAFCSSVGLHQGKLLYTISFE